MVWEKHYLTLVNSLAGALNVLNLLGCCFGTVKREVLTIPKILPKKPGCLWGTILVG
jgi:hypothetical protein